MKIFFFLSGRLEINLVSGLNNSLKSSKKLDIILAMSGVEGGAMLSGKEFEVTWP